MPRSKASDDLAAVAERGHAFLHLARGLQGLTPHQQARIGRRLQDHLPSRRTGNAALVRVFAAVALVLTVGTAAAWATGALERIPGFDALFRWARGRAPVAVTSPASSPPDRGGPPQFAGSGSPAGAPEPAAGLAPDPLPAVAENEGTGALVRRPAHSGSLPSRVPPDRRRHAAPPAPPSAPSPEGQESAIVLEGRSFAGALELWHAHRDAAAALVALDQHERRFAHGQMRVEASVLRAEILLAAGRQRDALAVLDRVPVDQVPRGRELRTVRGELRVRFGRCEEGRFDLTPIAAGADATAARAKKALAQCP